MAKPKLLVIDPAVAEPETQGVGEVVRDWPGDHRLLVPVLNDNEDPGPDDYDVDAVVLLGSAASVHEDLDWARKLEAWVRPIVVGEVDVPLLGVCYGHQLIAHMAGGRVGFHREDHTKRLGIEETELLDNRLMPERPRLRVVVSHCEEVKTVPAGYRAIARRPGVAIDGLEHESLPVFSFQFHPEAREEFCGRRSMDLDQIDDRLRRDSSGLIRAFHRFALSRP